jgi:hypothetical protein
MKATFDELYTYQYWNEHGYITGLGRDYPHPKRSHLYRGTMSNPGEPLCRRGWNRDNGESYSIWRNNIGEYGNCGHCIKRARREIKEKSQSLRTTSANQNASGTSVAPAERPAR